MRRLTKTFCDPRTGPVIAERRDVAVNRDARRVLAELAADPDDRRTAERSARQSRPPADIRAAGGRPRSATSRSPDTRARAASTSRETCVASATSDFRNLRRAGRLKKRSATSMQVPSRVPTSRTDASLPAVDAHLGAALRAARAACAGRSATPRRCSAAPRRGTRACGSRRDRPASRILLVACRSTASCASSGSIPSPSSSTRISFLPPSSMVTAIRVAPASSAFSTSSLTTEAGRSTTSPAAI